MGLAFHLFFTRKSYVLSDLRKKEAVAEYMARERRAKAPINPRTY